MDMKISDVIKKLREVESEHGDILVVLTSNDEDIVVTVRDEDFSICSNGGMYLNDFDAPIDAIENGKVLLIGEWMW